MHLLFLLVCLVASPYLVSGALIGSLARRQVSIAAPSPLPAECASTCSPVNSEVSLGCPTEACCTTTFETEYYNCLECVGAAVDAGNYSIAQNSLNLLWTTCVDVGFVLPRMELPGQSNSSNATSTASALFPSASTAAATRASDMWSREQVQALIGAAVLFGIAGLW